MLQACGREVGMRLSLPAAPHCRAVVVTVPAARQATGPVGQPLSRSPGRESSDVTILPLSTQA